MISLLCSSPSKEAGKLVLAAVQRSVSASQTQWTGPDSIERNTPKLVIAVNVSDTDGERLLSWLSKGTHKLVLFGRLPQCFIKKTGSSMTQWHEHLEEWSRSMSAPIHGHAESQALIKYTPLAFKLGGRDFHRALERFDYANEWNNLGFGAIRANGSIWALSVPIQTPPTNCLANLTLQGKIHCSYAALFDWDQASILWFNRPVGPIDSFEWRLVENFFSSYRFDDLPCQPVLKEIPWGYDAAITMRLDCDEDIESARPLWETYRDHGIPLSLAIHTTNVVKGLDTSLLEDVIASGGSILSHSATHAPNWGGNYEKAFYEAETSRAILRSLTGREIKYAVSPFHQTPFYSLAALSDMGYKGCVGGIISSDPSFLFSRGGIIADLPEDFVGHSQQCMLHGDCLLKDEDPLSTFKQSFDFSFESAALFGYLDHPFSVRYQYGWPSEELRIKKHQDLLRYIHSRANMPLFMSEDEALDFLSRKSSIRILDSSEGFQTIVPISDSSSYDVAIDFKGRCFRAVHKGFFS